MLNKLFSIPVILFAICLAMICSPVATAQYHQSFPEKDIAPLEKNCLQGKKSSCEVLARYYDSIGKVGGDRGLSADQAFAKKIDWAEKGCGPSAPYSCDAAGWAYEFGKESRTQDFKKALHFYEIGCENRSGLSCNNLAYLNLNGQGADADAFAASMYFEKACKLGYESSCAQISSSKSSPEPKSKPKQSYDEYLKEYRLDNFTQSCNSGVAESCWALGWEHVKNNTYSRGSSQFKTQMKKACDMGHTQACTDMNISAAPPATAQKNTVRKSQNYAAMEFGPLQDACVKSNSQSACVEVYNRMRGEDPEAYVVAEHICWTFNRSQYCYEAGMDLMTGRGNTPTDRTRAFNNFYKGCYIRDKGQAESCYFGAVISFSEGGRKGSYDAMLMLETPCRNGYRDSCAFKKKAQRSGDAAVASANAKLRANHDDAMECKKTRVVGNGGRTYTSYDCRTNREWRLGKKR